MFASRKSRDQTFNMRDSSEIATETMKFLVHHLRGTGELTENELAPIDKKFPPFSTKAESVGKAEQYSQTPLRRKAADEDYKKAFSWLAQPLKGAESLKIHTASMGARSPNKRKQKRTWREPSP